MDTPAVVLTALENNPQVIVSMIQEFTRESMTRRPEPNDWSAHEHACHLAEVHPVFFQRLDAMIANPDAPIEPYSPSEEDEAGGLLKRDLDEELRRFASDREKLVAKLRKLTEEQWLHEVQHPEYRRYSLLIAFRHLALHDMAHAYRIEELLVAEEGVHF